jgi:hypothetical protein
LIYTENDVYKTYPAIHLEKTLTVDFKQNRNNYVLFRDLLAHVSAKDINGESLEEIKTNYGYKSDGDSLIQTFDIPVGQLPIGDHKTYVGIIGENSNSNLIDTVEEFEFSYEEDSSYQIGERCIEVYEIIETLADTSTQNRYDFTVSYENGYAYVNLKNNIESDSTLTIKVKTYENVDDISIVYSDVPINFYVEDSDSINLYGSRDVKEIFLPFNSLSLAKEWANKFLKINAHPILQRSYNYIHLLKYNAPSLGDTIDGEKIVEISCRYKNGMFVEGTAIAGDVDNTILEIIKK